MATEAKQSLVDEINDYAHKLLEKVRALHGTDSAVTVRTDERLGSLVQGSQAYANEIEHEHDANEGPGQAEAEKTRLSASENPA